MNKTTEYQNSNSTEVAALKSTCPLPTLMQHLGMGAFAKASCKSPFRKDDNASWGIFEGKDGWYFKDHGDGASGDEITFLAHYLGLDSRADFPLLVNLLRAIAAKVPETSKIATDIVEPVPTNQLPDGTGFGPGTNEQIERLAKLRKLTIDGLQCAQKRGVLVFGTYRGFEVWGVRDATGKLIEIRRLDGEDFPASGSRSKRKSHALKNSQKSWPLGLTEAKDCASIMLVEGAPDFLAAHCLISKEQGAETGKCAPVGMLSANASIDESALAMFCGKKVVIYPHLDAPGLKGGQKWAEQLKGAGAQPQLFDISKVNKVLTTKWKDLNDLASGLTPTMVKANEALNTITP